MNVMEEVLRSMMYTLADEPLLKRLFLASLEMTVLAGLVWIAIRAKLVRSARLQSFLWLLVLVKPLVVVTMGAMVPILQFEVPASADSSAYRAGASTVIAPDSNVPVRAGGGDSLGTAKPTATAEKATPPQSASRAWSLSEWLTRIWCGGVLIVGAYVVFDRLRLRRLIARTHPPAPEIALRYSQLADALKIKRPPHLLVTEMLESPALAGTLRPTILIPSWLAAEGWSKKLDWSVRHELTHWRLGDLWGHVARQAANVLFFFLPVTWWASRQWQEASELACDRAVVRTDHEVEDYAENLVAMLAKIRGERRGALASGLFATRTQIGRRIAALFGNPLKHPARLGVSAMIAIACVAVVSLSVGSSLAADSKVPSTEQTAPDAQHTMADAIVMLSTTSESQQDRVKTVLDMVRGVPQATALEALSKGLQSKVATERRSAVYILGALPWDDASPVFPALRALLTHEESATRGMAALSLANIGDAGSYDAILEMAKNDKDAYARRCAAAALGELGDSKALDALNGISQDPDPGVSGNAKNAIDRLTFLRDHANATDDAKPVIRAIWMVAGSSAQDETRLGRALDLARGVTPEARATVLDEASKSPSTAIRNSAEYIKGRIEAAPSTAQSPATAESSTPAAQGVQGAIDQAIAMLSTTSEMERDRVKSVFDIVRGQPQKPALEALAGWLKSTDANKRRSAVYIIGALPWDDVSPALPPLRDLLKHYEVATRGMAALSLATVGDTACYDAVLEMAQKDKDGYARRCAAWALGELGDPKALEPLKGIKADSDMGVFSNAENAIDRLTFLRDHATASKEAMPAVRGIWMVAGSTAWDETRIGRALDLVRTATPEARSMVLEEASKSPSIAIRNSAEFVKGRINEAASAPADAAVSGAAK